MSQEQNDSSNASQPTQTNSKGGSPVSKLLGLFKSFRQDNAPVENVVSGDVAKPIGETSVTPETEQIINDLRSEHKIETSAEEVQASDITAAVSPKVDLEKNEPEVAKKAEEPKVEEEQAQEEPAAPAEEKLPPVEPQ